MRVETLTESASRTLALTDAQAHALMEAGRRLASDASWWGQSDDEPERSVVRCTPTVGGAWEVRVVDAVGVIVVDDLELVIHPKIPLSHFLYLLEVGGYIPRLADQLGIAAVDASLWHLVARWYVTAAEQALRRELIRDYQPDEGALPAARGQIVALATARGLYVGRLAVHCRYEEFGFDTPLNRILKAAAQTVAASVTLDPALRRRARALSARVDPVGQVKPLDLRVTTDRRTRHFQQALGWARHVLLARGRSLHIGEADVWTFLIRTPEPVEAGIRAVLQARFPQAGIEKRGRQIGGTQVTLNPDLVLAHDVAVADVKYKLASTEWNRPDLYQLVTFATGFKSRSGALINFAPAGVSGAKDLAIGDVSVSHLPWPTDAALAPAQAAALFANRVAQWLALSGSSVDKPS